MKVAPISFGKAVKVNGSSDVAFDIARLANEKKVSKSERSAQKEVKAIFDDVKTAPARVLTYTTPNNNEEVYVSGKESLIASKLDEQVATGIIQAGDALLTDNETHKYHKFELSKIRQMNRYNENKKNLALNSSPNFCIEAEYSKDGASVKEVNRKYAQVYALAGTPEQIRELRGIIAKTNGYATCLDATDLYKGGRSSGLCSAAVTEGKEIAFVVTGKASNRALSFMDYGWSTVNAVSRRLQQFISLENVQEQAKQIQDAMEYDCKREQK